MTISVGTVVAFLAGLVALVAALASAWAVSRSSAAQTTIALQEKNITALNARVDILESERDDCKRELAVVKQSNDVLSNIVASIRRGDLRQEPS